jgi:hypothetical protein
MSMFRISNKMFRFLSLALILGVGIFEAGWSGSQHAKADSTYQTLPFSQNWGSTGLITTNDNWSGVPGVEAYLGQDITPSTAVDPQTLLTTSSVINDLDVIANQTNPNTLSNGGVAEFDGIADPTIALQGSGTADAPYLILYLNTTGQTGIHVSYDLRDIDGSTDNAIQPVALQYRIGTTGNFTNVPAGFVADATTGPSLATLVTPVSVTLPAAADNQAQLQVRIITSNAASNDEWVGIDNINVTGTTAVTHTQHVSDYNGDGKTDYAIVRNLGPANGDQLQWWMLFNGTNTTGAVNWGIAVGDTTIPADFDGDGKTDVAVWRSFGSESAFYILESQGNTFRAVTFGLEGDDPSVVADYDGDGKADPAVFRGGTSPGDQGWWYFLGSNNNPGGNITFVPWGTNGDFPAPGDYDGDGKADFVVVRDDGNGYAVFWSFQTTGGVSSTYYGLASDLIVPGDYDGDGKTDMAVVRWASGYYQWFYRPSSTGVISAAPAAVWGVNGADEIVQGDYDGDGKTDFAVFRDASATFWVQTAAGTQFGVPWGQAGDVAPGAYNVR